MLINKTCKFYVKLLKKKTFYDSIFKSHVNMHMQLIGETDMKNKQHWESKTKYKLKHLKQTGIKYVLWTLSVNQLEYVKHLFSKAICDMYPILKCLKAEKQYRKKSYIYRALNKKEKKILDEFHVKYYVAKHKIVLNQ